jgi:hypothetical protein
MVGPLTLSLILVSQVPNLITVPKTRFHKRIVEFHVPRSRCLIESIKSLVKEKHFAFLSMYDEARRLGDIYLLP